MSKISTKTLVKVQVKTKLNVIINSGDSTLELTIEEPFVVNKKNIKDGELINIRELAIEAIEISLLKRFYSVKSYSIESLDYSFTKKKKPKGTAKDVSKPVWLMDVTTGSVKKYPSRAAASKAIGGTPSTVGNYISNVKNGRITPLYEKYLVSTDGTNFNKNLTTKVFTKLPVVVSKLDENLKPTGKTKHYKDVNGAAKLIGTLSSTIRQRLRRGKSNVFGRWVVWSLTSYKNGKRDVITNDRFRHFFSIGVKQINLETNETVEFKSINQAAEHIGLCPKVFRRNHLDKKPIGIFSYESMGDSCSLEILK